MSEAFIGEIRYFGGNFAPVNWEKCAGQLLSIAENEALFVLIGTTYGGDGATTFSLPDLRGRIPVHQGTNPRDGRTYVLGASGGVETVTLTQGQLPTHTHPLQAAAASATTSAAQNMVPASWADTPYAPATAGTPKSLHPGASAAAGGNLPHDNMPPFQAVGYIICVAGIFPSQG